MQVRDRKKFKRLLVRNDISARQLAGAVGYGSHTSINRLLAGDATTVKPEKARAIARYLRVEVDELFVPPVSSRTRRSAKSRVA